MLKRLVMVTAALLVVLATACGSDKESSKSDKTQDGATVVATKPVATKAAATKAAPTKEANTGGASGNLEPLSLLTSGVFGGQAEGGLAEAADPELASILIADSDLPTTYASVGGDMGYSMDLPDGKAKMAMRTFSQGDPNLSEMTPRVVSAAVSVPPSVLTDFNRQLDQLDQMSTEEIQNALVGPATLGAGFKDLSVKRVTDLGDGGLSMHMVMDMSSLIEGLGGLAQGGVGDAPTALAFDLYAFTHGGTVLMVMTMSPAGQESSVDALALAKVMEGRAQ